MNTPSTTTPVSSAVSLKERLVSFAKAWWYEIVAVQGALLCGPDIDPLRWPVKGPTKRS